MSKTGNNNSSLEHMRQLVAKARAEAARISEERRAVKPPPAAVPGFTIFSELGRGGMGVVYKARQLSTKRLVALKVMLHGYYASEDAVRRFRREVELTARLQHEGIVRVLESGETSTGEPYYAMDLMAGDRLDRWIAGPGADTAAILGLFKKLCEAVHYAHKNDVVHRDLKPANVLVDSAGNPHVLDFGLSKATNQTDSRSTQSWTVTVDGQVMGTAPYLSPEQAMGISREIDKRTDVYALGAMLYEALTGALPTNPSGSPEEIARRAAEDEPPRPSSLSKKIDRELDLIILAALDKDKTRRYQSAKELGDDISRYLANEPILIRPKSSLYVLRKKLQRHRRRIAVGMAAAALVLGTVGVALRERAEALYEARRNLAGLDIGLEQGRIAPGSVADTLAGWVFMIAEAHLLRAKALHYNGQTEDAVFTLIDQLDKGTIQERAAYRALLVEIHRAVGRDEEALAVEAQGSAPPPDDAESWFLHSFATLRRKKAIQCAEQAATLDQSSPLLQERLLHLCLLESDDRAIACADRLVELEHGSGESELLRANVLLALQRIPEAIQHYTYVLDTSPNLAMSALRYRGHAYRAAGEYEKALADLIRDAEMEREVLGRVTPWVLWQRVAPLWILGRHDEAVETCRQIQQKILHPSYTSVRWYLILIDQGKLDEAQDVLDAALADPDDSWLGRILKCLGGNPAPAGLVARADSTKHLCEAYYYAGEACLLAGRTVEAREWFRACVDTNLMFDPETWPPDPMNEYELARWRLANLVDNGAMEPIDESD